MTRQDYVAALKAPAFWAFAAIQGALLGLTAWQYGPSGTTVVTAGLVGIGCYLALAGSAHDARRHRRALAAPAAPGAQMAETQALLQRQVDRLNHVTRTNPMREAS